MLIQNYYYHHYLSLNLEISRGKTNHNQNYYTYLIGFFCIFSLVFEHNYSSWTNITTIFCYSIINFSIITRSSLLLNLLGKAVVNGIVLFSLFYFHCHPLKVTHIDTILSSNLTGSFETFQVI